MQQNVLTTPSFLTLKEIATLATVLFANTILVIPELMRELQSRIQCIMKVINNTSGTVLPANLAPAAVQ